MTSNKPQTKRAQLVSRKSGTSIDAIQHKLAWQPHIIHAEIPRLRKQELAVTCVPSPKGAVYGTIDAERAALRSLNAR